MASYFPNDFGALREDNVKTLLKPLNSGAFNTISSAYAVLALNAFSNEEDDKKYTFFRKASHSIRLFRRLTLMPRPKD